MLLSVTTESDSCSLEVAEDLELENFKALCEAEINIPSSSMTILVNGQPLTDDKKSLQQLGVKDGDLVMILQDSGRRQQQDPTAAASNSAIPSDVAQFDFSSIKVPGSMSRSSGAGASQQQAAGAAGSRQSTSAAGGGEEDPAVILDLLKSHPEQLARLSHNNPVLAEAAHKGLEAFSKVLKEQHQARVDKERQRIRMITSDPFDAEAQKLIATEIEKQNIDANMEAAMEYNPESFGTVQMLYINCSVNGHPVKAFIDSGAQTTIMSETCARRCNIMRLVDERWAGVAKGVGTQKIIGRVHMVQLEIEGVYLTSSFSILQEQRMDMLLGLDMLKRHQMVIHLGKNELQIGTSNTATRFLSDSELPDCTRITSAASFKATQESEEQAQEKEREDIARASALSSAAASIGDNSSSATVSGMTPAATTDESMDTDTSNVEPTLPANVSDRDISEIMAAGFSRDEAVAELAKQGGDKTQALAVLFASKFAFN